MKIKNLTIENFKSAPNRTIDLEKLNVFIGANGKGKTSTQNALRYVLNGKLPDDPIKHGEDHLAAAAVLDDGQNTTIERWNYLSDTFRVNSEEVKEAAFMKTAEKYKALCESNGFFPKIGANSHPYFLTQRPDVLWSFIMTGKTDGARLHGVKELELEMYDGTVLYKRKGQPSKVMVDGKRVTGKALAELIRNRMQGDEKALDIVTSSAAMNAMEMTDFAKYLISIVPVKIDFEKLSKLAKLTKEEAYVLKPVFPAAPNPITTADVANVYKLIYAKRAEINRTMDEWKKRSVYTGMLPIPDGKKVADRLDEIKKLCGSIAQIKAAWEVYNRRVEERRRLQENLNSWQEKLKAYDAVEKPDDSNLEALKKESQELRKAIEDASRDSAGLERANAPIIRMLSALDTTICPLCDKLVCSTDKTSCKKDLEDSVNENLELKKRADERLNAAKEKAEKVDREIERIRVQQNMFAQKEQISKQIESLKNSMPEVPAEPERIPDTAKLQDEEKHLEEYLKQNTIYDECIRAGEEYEKAKKIYDLYCILVRKSEPKKGLLTNTILEYILNPFKDHVNAFLKEIAGDFEVSFRMDDDGLQVYCKPHGRQTFMPVKALSTGEKLLVVFALMDMVSSVSNSRILLFDCVENLDTGNIEALINLLQKPEVQARYDHVILSIVNHKSIEKIVERNALNWKVVRF